MRFLRASASALVAASTTAVALAIACGIALAMTGPESTASVSTVNVPLPANVVKAGGPLILHLEDVTLPPGSSGLVRVYADVADADALRASSAVEPKPDDPHYLGYFTVLPKTSAEATRGMDRKSVTLDLTHKASRLAGKTDVTLTLVALGRPPTTATPQTRDASAGKPKVGRAYFASK